MKFLGVLFDMSLRWSAHAEALEKQLEETWAVLDIVKHVLNPRLLRELYFGVVESRLLYGSVCWAYDSSSSVSKVADRMQQRAARTITGVISSTPRDLTLRSAAVLPIRDRAQILATRFMERLRRLGPRCPAAARICGREPVGNRKGQQANVPTIRRAYLSPAWEPLFPPVTGLPLTLPLDYRDFGVASPVFVKGSRGAIPSFPTLLLQRHWKKEQSRLLCESLFGKEAKGSRHLLLTDA